MAAGDAVQQIKERLSIVDVVASYVELHKAGKNYKGKSPFTNEKTPSFYVSPDKGMYYCFSSSQGGDIFTFIQTMEGVDFKGALQILADKAGVELVPEDPKKRSERDTGFRVLDDACTFFEERLAKHADAKRYLKDRGVAEETLTKWRIGYAPGPPHGGWRELRNSLATKKHTDAELLQAGLVKSAEGKEPYDLFRDRIMFPIFDASGRVIAFSGRILEKDSEAPKYVNSPETDFFNKSEVLYGYDKAKQGMRHFDFALIVEGQFDVVLSHQAGYTNAVAVSGTALTAHHVGLLQRLTNRIVLALDADRAGVEAVKRAAELMLARGIDLKVARLPEGKDPADLIRENPKQFKEVIGHATHMIEFLLEVLKAGARDDRAYKLIVRDEVLPHIARMQNEIDAEHFMGVVAGAIGTSKDAISLEVARLREEAAHAPQHIREVIEEKVSPQAVGSRADELLAYLAVAAEAVAPKLGAVMEKALLRISGTDAKAHREALTPERESEFSFRIDSHFDGMSEKQIIDELASRLHELELRTLRSSLRTKKEALYIAERDGDTETAGTLEKEVDLLSKELGEASQKKDPFAASEVKEV